MEPTTPQPQPEALTPAQRRLLGCTCMLRVAARVVRKSTNPDLVEAASELLDSLALPPEQRASAEDRCPVHNTDKNAVALITLIGLIDKACERRGERPVSELVAEQVAAAGAEFYQMQEASRA